MIKKRKAIEISEETKRIGDLLEIKEQQLKSLENERLGLESKYNELSL